MHTTWHNLISPCAWAEAICEYSCLTREPVVSSKFFITFCVSAIAFRKKCLCNTLLSYSRFFVFHIAYSKEMASNNIEFQIQIKFKPTTWTFIIWFMSDQSHTQYASKLLPVWISRRFFECSIIYRTPSNSKAVLMNKHNLTGECPIILSISNGLLINGNKGKRTMTSRYLSQTYFVQPVKIHR